MSKDWYLMTNRHLSGYEKEEFEKTYNVFDEILQQSPEATTITVKDKQKQAIIQSASNPNKRTILYKDGDVEYGDNVKMDGLDWLVVDFPFNNNWYVKSTLELCNEVLELHGEPKRTYKGEDAMGRPIYETSQPPIYRYPCVIHNVREINADENEPINLTEGDIALFISYVSYPPIEIGQEFTFYGRNYRIIGRDESKIINGKGILILTADKTT